MARNISFNWTETTFSSEISPSPIIVNPNDSYALNQSFSAYGCFVGVLIVVFIVLMLKITFKRKRFQTRNAAVRQTIARQNHLSTVSRSVDGNSDYSNEERRDSDATIKIDLPPTYEEVMKNFENRNESGATPNTLTGGGGGSVETRDTRGMTGVEIVIIPTSAQRNIL